MFFLSLWVNDLQFTTFHEVQSDCEDDFPFTEQWESPELNLPSTASIIILQNVIKDEGKKQGLIHLTVYLIRIAPGAFNSAQLFLRASLVTQTVKNLPAMQETRV